MSCWPMPSIAIDIDTADDMRDVIYRFHDEEDVSIAKMLFTSIIKR